MGRLRWLESTIAVGIVVSAVLGAFVAWRSSVLSNRASDLAEQAIQNLVRVEQQQLETQTKEAHDRRLFDNYREHVEAERLLTERADEVRATDDALAGRLTRQARERRRLAEAISSFFLVGYPLETAEGGAVYVPFAGDSDAAIELRPDETLIVSEITQDVVVDLVGVVALLVAGLFFLTLAQLTRTNARAWLAGAGGVVVVIGVGLFLAVQWSAP